MKPSNGCLCLQAEGRAAKSSYDEKSKGGKPFRILYQNNNPPKAAEGTTDEELLLSACCYMVKFAALFSGNVLVLFAFEPACVLVYGIRRTACVAVGVFVKAAQRGFVVYIIHFEYIRLGNVVGIKIRV